jgi:hypothetical protein
MGCKSIFTPEGRLYSSARKSIQQNHFDTATANLVESLIIDSEYKKAQNLLKESYYKGIDYYEEKIKRNADIQNINHLDTRAESYMSLDKMMQAIKKLPPLIDEETGLPLSFALIDYQNELAEALNMAAEAHYREGIRLGQLSGRENAKNASREFLKSLAYIPGYKDAVQREAEARDRAMQRLVILPFVIGNNRYFGVDVPEIITGSVESILMNDSEAMEYTQIVEQEQIDTLIRAQQIGLQSLYSSSTSVEVGNLLNGNLILTGRITQLDWSDPRTLFQTITRTAEIQATADDLIDNPGLQVGDLLSVTADVTYYRQVSSASIRMNYRLIDIETGQILFSDTFSDELDSEAAWATFTGDKRALTSQDNQAVNVWKRDAQSSRKLIQQLSDEAGKLIAEELSIFLK